MATYTIHIDKRAGVYDGIEITTDLTPAEETEVRNFLRSCFDAGTIYDYNIHPLEGVLSKDALIRRINEIAGQK